MRRTVLRQYPMIIFKKMSNLTVPLTSAPNIALSIRETRIPVYAINCAVEWSSRKLFSKDAYSISAKFVPYRITEFSLLKFNTFLKTIRVGSGFFDWQPANSKLWNPKHINREKQTRTSHSRLFISFTNQVLRTSLNFGGFSLRSSQLKEVPRRRCVNGISEFRIEWWEVLVHCLIALDS